MPPSRRRFLRTLAGGLPVVIAGCLMRAPVGDLPADARGTDVVNRTYDHSHSDLGSSISATDDGGFAIVGETTTYGDDPSVHQSDVLAVKTDPSGQAEWVQPYGGDGIEEGDAVVNAADGGFTLGAWTTTGTPGSDFWLVGLASDGSVEWTGNYGGGGNQYPSDLVRTRDGGFAMSGEESVAGEALLVKIDADGVERWRATFGDAEFGDTATSVAQTEDGGYIVGGLTQTSSHSTETWVQRLDAGGQTDWRHTIFEEGDTRIGTVLEPEDGAILVAGSTQRFVGSPSGWLLGLTVDGERRWHHEVQDLFGTSVVRTPDGQFAFGGEPTDTSGGFRILTFASEGELLGTRRITDSHLDVVWDFDVTEDAIALVGKVTKGTYRTTDYGTGDAGLTIVKQ